MYRTVLKGKELSLSLAKKVMLKSCLLLFFFLFSFNSCTRLGKFFEPSLEFEACDSSYSLYDGKNHFFHRDFVRENGQLDQHKWWFGAFRMENSPCNPLKKKKAKSKSSKD